MGIFFVLLKLFIYVFTKCTWNKDASTVKNSRNTCSLCYLRYWIFGYFCDGDTKSNSALICILWDRTNKKHGL